LRGGAQAAGDPAVEFDYAVDRFDDAVDHFGAAIGRWP
jgi:hypothetical protein